MEDGAAMPPNYPRNEAARAGQNEQKHVRAAQIRLLYENANTGIAVTIVAAPLVAGFQWFVVQHLVVLSWLGYMLMVSGARFLLIRRYWRTSPSRRQMAGWGAAFSVGSGLAGVGWGTAGILLYPKAELMSQVVLVFVLGGMMLGGASILAARRDAFLAFLLPTGILPAIRLLSEGDREHVAMGLLAILFTGATVTTTWRFYRAVESSLTLQFRNEDLFQDLQVANGLTEALNQQLELRVQERTAELHQATVRLRAEIEQREQMEEELLRVRNLESLGLLAGGIAHDFNNFLTVVQGNIELARMQLDADTPVQEVLKDSASACQRAAILSTQLLTFAKGGAPIRRIVSVAKLIVDAVHLARAGAPVSIDVDIAEDLWSAEVDAGQIGQVLHNLLLNAKQAMPDSGIIEVHAENVLSSDKRHDSGAFVRISIRDYGSGIPAEILPRIFDPYFTTKQSGSGLGLATSYAIVSKHGGRISVDSKLGVGTEFIVVLPAALENPAPESPTGSALRSGTGRLLVMDDEEALRTLLERSLSALGYEVQSARDGAEAIALYEAAQASGRVFDAVLLDLTVSGGMGGIEAAAKLRELDPSVKLIVSSGYSDASVMSSFREYGFDEMIPKPWQAAQVSEVFRRVLVGDAERKAI
jgi:signal transduction histidine kinase/CheY-like chemotaxis protein